MDITDISQKPLGVFDSGLGGLTALRRLRSLCPNEDIVYFGDTGRVPYGTKSAEIIRKYALQDARFLKSFDCKAILVACGTVSANAIDELKAEYGDAVMGVIEPTVNKAAKITKKGGTVLILGTEATVESGAYEKLLTKIRPDIKVERKACPMFVPLVENGYTDAENPAVKAIVSDYLSPFAGKADTAILGCTHYPLLCDAIEKALVGTVTVDSGSAAAEMMRDYLVKSGLAAKKSGGKTSLYVSDGVRNFEKLAGAFLGSPVCEAKKTDIEKY